MHDTAKYTTLFVVGLLFTMSGIQLGAATPLPCACEEWVATYESPGPSRATANVVSVDGSLVFVTGASRGGSDEDFVTLAYDTTNGDTQWIDRYDHARDDDYPFAIAVSPDGSIVVVTGRSTSLDNEDDYATIAYRSSDGSRLWVARYDGPANESDVPIDVAVSPDSATVFVTGRSEGTTSREYTTLAYDSASGNEKWVSRYNGLGDGLDTPAALSVSPDGSFIAVTGASDSGQNVDYATVAYATDTGSELWVAHYDGPPGFVDQGSDVAIGADGSRVFVTGASQTAPGVGGQNYATLAYDSADGTEIWMAGYEGLDNAAILASDQPVSIRTSPDGSKVFVTGTSEGVVTSPDYATVAYDAESGNELWGARYAMLWQDSVSSLELSVDGSLVYVAGFSYTANAATGLTGGVAVPALRNMVTVAYDADNGHQVWTARYQGGGTGLQVLLAVSPADDQIFVSGTTTESSDLLAGKSHYTTLAYNMDEQVLLPV